ncbi:MAG: alpha/beta hydrolase [Ruminococcaceae bacterium]|nr:alpha/beta hydrolase [Oscillospiraceae bacterium]
MSIKKKKLLKTIIISVLCTVICFSVISLLVINHYFGEVFSRSELTEYTRYIRYDDIKEDVPRYDISFNSHGTTINGHVYGSGDKGLVIAVHGLNSNEEETMDIIHYFCQKGWTVMAYNHSGCYLSGGNSQRGLAQSMIDLDSALTFCENDEKLKSLPTVLVGHSMGGYAVCSVLNFDHDIKAVASFSGYNTPYEELCFFVRKFVGDAFATLQYPYMWLYNSALFGDKANISAVDGINKSDIPVMLIHGNDDATVPYDSAGIIAHKDEITNPNVKYILRTENVVNSHTKVFYSLPASEYSKEADKLLNELESKYNNEIPESELKGFYNSIDKFRMSELDKEIFDSINEMFLKAVSEE